MNRMRRILGSFALAAALVAVPSVAAPVCNGLTATVYVNGGFIVGGPNNGSVYTGTLNGGNGSDVIVGTSGADIINGGNGEDTICALEGNDTVSGGNGNDWVDGGGGDDSLFGENGSDTLQGGGGNDTVDGGSGPDVCGGETLVGCESTIQTKLIVIVEVRGGSAVPSDFTVRVDGNTVGYLQAAGVGAPGYGFNLNPGYYITDAAWVPGYAMDREDYDNPGDCNSLIGVGEQKICTITMNFLAPANVGDTLSCATVDAASSGWYGQYFNYPHSRDDMYNTYAGNDPVVPGDGYAGTLRGQPLVFGDDAYEWYHAGGWGDYSRFARIDPDLYFGEYYWPFYGNGGLVEEETYLPGTDNHFGAHWSGVVTVPAPGVYGFLGRLSDSLYIYVNGDLQPILQFQIPGTQLVRFGGTLELKTGDLVDIFYANRQSSGSSSFMIQFLNPAVTVKPYCSSL